ncbi:MAG: hypothetical protein JWM27_4106 [Gemmatimonadetes bacterium]|nr:hypothetical protein [Gemmatimonadota bacterium]
MVMMAAAACSRADPERIPEILSERGVVLSGPGARRVFQQCSRPAPQDVQALWTPTPADVAALEAALPAFVAGRPDRPDGLIAAYTRQYVGYVAAGRRMIYVNGFRHAPARGDAWRHAPAVTCGGGRGEFGAVYDVEDGVFVNYEHNGGA